MRLPLVYIILLNYNGYEDTIECVNSIAKDNYSNKRVIIVDNNSSDGSYEKFREELKDTILIKNKENLGFSAGNNVGIKHAMNNNADYIMLLNNDTVVDNNFILPLVNELEKDNKIGIAGGKIYYYDYPNTIWSAGGYIDYKRGCAYHYLKDIEDNQEASVKKEVTFLTGCMQIFSRQLINNIGYLDENYFLYFEDADFCLKAINAGYKLMYIPKSKIYHKVSKSSVKDSPLFVYYTTRNRLYFIKKIHKKHILRIIPYSYFIFGRLLYIFKNYSSIKNIYNGIKDYTLNNLGKK